MKLCVKEAESMHEVSHTNQCADTALSPLFLSSFLFGQRAFNRRLKILK